MTLFQPFLIALQFLTRLPVRFRQPPTESAIGQSLIYYPAVGLLLGLLLLGASHLLIHAPALLRAAFVLVIWIVITGGLHLDGLADTADAWIGSHGDRERALAIMKDPHCGPIAVTALVVILLTKFAALASLSPAAWVLVILVPTLARTTAPLLFATTTYVRPNGLGAVLAARRPSFAVCSAIIAVTSIVVLLVAKIHGAVLILVQTMVFFLGRRTMINRLGGMTGDTAGALIEISETLLLATAALLGGRLPLQ